MFEDDEAWLWRHPTYEADGPEEYKKARADGLRPLDQQMRPVYEEIAAMKREFAEVPPMDQPPTTTFSLMGCLTMPREAVVALPPLPLEHEEDC